MSPFDVIKPIRVILSEDKELYSFIKNIFGFYPGNIFLYKLAFRHKSLAKELTNGTRVSNERLEYLGDAILSAVVADYLFKIFPIKGEGFLTEMRSRIVSRASLNKLSQKLGLDKLIQVSTEGNNVYKSMNGDAFEALIGAIYLDKGYQFTRRIIIEKIILQHFDLDELENNDTNYKSRLIEWAQREKHSVEFIQVSEVGHGYTKQYVIEVLIDKRPFGKGRDYSIKGAEQNAAMKTLIELDISKA
ncbi:MAG: ribonuclease III [Bacteroidales bacterium]|nr:ribonuclease III [Bacteroidales bacterium]